MKEISESSTLNEIRYSRFDVSTNKEYGVYQQCICVCFLKERYHLGDVGVDGRMIWRWSSCEHRIEISGFIKAG